MTELSIISVIYEGIEYDITNKIDSHPGPDIIRQILRNLKDISGYFKAIHSCEAEQELKSCRQIRKVERSKMEKAYVKIEERVKRYYTPNYVYQSFYLLIILLEYLLVIFLVNPIYKVIVLTLALISTFWFIHSQLHLDKKYLKNQQKLFLTFLGGFSTQWWRKKHYQHHMFTNTQFYYKNISSTSVFKYPFIVFKWRLNAFLHACQNFLWAQILCIGLHYYIFFISINWNILLNACLISSFITNLILQGNHEKQTIYLTLKQDFIHHQLQTTTNYSLASSSYNQLFNFLTGGYIYHTEHHLFPKVPFYHLPTISKIVSEELRMYNKVVKERDIIQ